MITKLRILIWYFSKPKYYSQLFFIFKKVIMRFFSYDKEKFLSRNRFIEKNTTEYNLIKKLYGKNKKLLIIENEYASILTKAKNEADKCPVKMGGMSNINLIYNLTINHKPKIILETGVAYGWSSLSFLLAIKFNKFGKLFSIDMPYPNLNNEKYVGCVIPDELKNEWNLLKMPDQIAIPSVLQKVSNIDMCHYDSDKSYEGRKWAYPKLWESLNEKGIFISDDISDNRAFEDFVNQINKNPYIIQYNDQYLGIIIK